MRPLPPHLATALARLAHALGDLWLLQSRLTALPSSRDLAAAEVAEAARRAAADLASIRERLAEVAAELPPSEDSTEIALHPLELARASLECILNDRLDPAIADLTEIGSAPEGSRRKPARASLECVLADSLCPAITALAPLLLVGEILPHADPSLRPS